ncbi:MAG: signal recognition particle-docking protein FtsY, partial [Alphaproteobacteria bacterium]
MAIPPWVDRTQLPLLAAGGVAVLALLGLLAFLVARRRRGRVSGRDGTGQVGVGREDAAPSSSAPPTAAQRFRAGLARSRSKLASRLAAVLGSDAPDLDDEILRVLIESDVGPKSAQEILSGLGRLPGDRRDATGVRDELRSRIEELVRGPEDPMDGSVRPWVVLVVGVNGVGKTTSIGKLAARHRALGRSVLLVAGDTFRAAAADQLSVWAERTGAQL